MKRLVFLFLCLANISRAQELTLDEAVALALAKHGDLAIERESLAIADAGIERARAVYEPTLYGDSRLHYHTDPVNSILSGAPAGEVAPTTRTLATSASLVQLLPTGATLSVFSALRHDETDSRLALLTPAWSTSLGAEIRQPLLQNRRIDPARRAIRIAHVDRSRAESSLRRAAVSVTAATERAYWNLVAARREVEIRESALALAGQQREDTRVRIEAGTQSGSDLAQTTAEVERRRGELVASTENRTRAENALRDLIGVWDRPVVPAASAAGGAIAREVDVQAAIDRALVARDELRELALRLDRQDVEIELSVDRVRPRVDLVASYTGRGVAGSENDDALEPFGPLFVHDSLDGGIDRSFGTLGENRFPDASLGFSVTLPIGNRAAKQDVAIARAVRRQAETALEQARQRVSLEVRNAAASVTSAAQRIDAAQAARAAAEVQLQAERDRFDAGTSNNFFVLTRQNDLAAAQLAEVVALTDYQKARSELARATGGSL